MNIDGIISISGKPGLFKIIAQGKSRIIIEDVETKKRRPAFASDKIIALNDITVFGHEEDLSLAEIFEKIYKKEEGKKSISQKEDNTKLRDYFETIWGEYNDQEVKDHDIKKIFQWYNLLIETNMLVVVEEKKKEEKKEKKETPEKKASKTSNPATKKAVNTKVKNTTASSPVKKQTQLKTKNK